MADMIDSLELDCSLCGTNLQLMGLTAAQLEFTMNLWKRDHTHTTRERSQWYRATADAVHGDDSED